MYQEHCLKEYKRKPIATPSPNAKYERVRRFNERKLLKQLSRYYRLRRDKRVWECPDLLKEGKLGFGRSFDQLRSVHSPAPLIVLEDVKRLFKLQRERAAGV